MRFAVIFVLALSAAAQTSADLVLINGNVRTLDAKRPRASALAVANGRLIAVGSDAEIRKFAASRTRTIDARGRLVIPGFNDSHVHFAAIGNRFFHLDLRTVGNASDVFKAIAHKARFLPKGRWLMGSGLSESIARDQALIDRLDAATQQNPVFIYLADPKKALINSRASREGSVRTVTGEQLAQIRRGISVDYRTNLPEIVETATNYAASLGITSVQDVHSDDLYEVLQDLARAGKLKTRVYDCLGIADWKRLADANLKPTKGLELVRRGCVKGFATDDEDEKTLNQIRSADAAGLQVMIHAIGERDVRVAVNSFAKANEAAPGKDRRFRVEHAYHASAADIDRMGKLGIIASMQPYLFYGSEDNYRGILSRGARLALGSDASMTDFNPLRAIEAALSSPNGPLTVEQAVIAHTVGSAYAEFQEDVKGSLSTGRVADFVILSDDIFAIEASKILDVEVMMTVADGRLVYERK